MTRRLRSRGLLGVMALVAGCGGGSSSGPIALQDLSTKVVSVLCNAERACGQFPDTASCEATVSSNLGQIQADVAAGKVMYDAASAGVCLDGLAASIGDCRLSAPRVRQPAACAQTFVGSVPQGGACLVSEDCVSQRCDFANTCGTASCCAGVCGAATPPAGSVAIAGACTSTEQCVAGAFCDFSATTPACAAVKAMGAACLSADECASGLACLPLGVTSTAGATSRICVKPPAEGETCAGAGTCDSRADFCDPATNTCRPRLATGAACTSGGDVCLLYDVCDATTGTCVARGRLGAACTTTNGNTCLGLPCTNGVCTAHAAETICPQP